VHISELPEIKINSYKFRVRGPTLNKIRISSYKRIRIILEGLRSEERAICKENSNLPVEYHII
jgi:hypothetical protein